ncbi:hypothetical protein V6Z12_A06G163400 [Gossypium hirsutum]
MRKCVRMDFKFVGDWIQAFGSVILSILTSKRKSQSLDGSRRRRTQRVGWVDFVPTWCVGLVRRWCVADGLGNP